MPVPDYIYFGEKPEGGGINYGEVRHIIDETSKLLLLKSRIDVLLIKQIDELSLKSDSENRKVYSPFPLMVLTFIAIETLGNIICDVEKIKQKSVYEQSKAITSNVYLLMERTLSNKPTKTFYAAFEKIHDIEDKKSIKRYSDIIHKYQRNTFIHGYQSRGVFLTENITSPFKIDENLGCIFINPYSFWDLFKITNERVFNAVINNSRIEWRKNALLYFEKLIS